MVAAGVTVCDPERAVLVVHDAAHDVAFVAVHDTVELPPVVMTDGVASIVTTGADGGVHCV